MKQAALFARIQPQGAAETLKNRKLIPNDLVRAGSRRVLHVPFSTLAGYWPVRAAGVRIGELPGEL